ncbi:hypothetical protein MMC13_000844 [Lambiella insularis]|nr:hypothetical protein [Lambiella insularis]
MVKFHYVNRKSEGLKLGQVVAKDLLRRIPPGSSHKAALRDPSVDLDVSGKALSDEAFGEIADALLMSMAYDGEHGRVVKLEEVCVKENELTAMSLRALARVVALAAADLMDLDLADNSISIITNDEADAWEAFLESFSECFVLRRLDLSGNALGPRAFEILARVYGRSNSTNDAVTWSQQQTERLHNTEKHIEDITGLGQTIRKPNSVQSRTGSISKSTTRSQMDPRGGYAGSPEPEELMSAAQNPLTRPATTLDASNLYPGTKGIRSIPYLIMANTSMDDTCALHLSYVIASHSSTRSLLQFVPPAKAGPPTQQLETYDQITGCQGIIYRGNDKIGNAGNRVLELAEIVRMNPSEEIMMEESAETVNAHKSSPTSSRRGSDAKVLQSPSATPYRKRSIFTTDSPEQSINCSARTTELQRARSRIQGDTLRDNGSQSNDLWRKSLKMLSVSRTILLEPRKMAGDHGKIEPREVPKISDIDRSRAFEPRPIFSTPSYAMKTAFPRLAPLKPLASANPNQQIVLRLPHRTKGSTVQPSHVMTSAVSPTDMRTATSVHKTPNNVDSYRSTQVGGLDDRLWSKIISLACRANGILSTDQALAVVKWARDRGTLEREMEALGKAENTQVWKVLEGMGCLAYVVEDKIAGARA